MKKICVTTLLSLGLLLTACTQAPESVKSNNHETKDVNKAGMVSAENVWNDLDDAYNTEYTKFKLPEKNLIKQEKFDEIYSAKVTYTNVEDDENWYLERIPKFEEAMGATVSGEPEKKKKCCYDHNDENYTVLLTRYGCGNITLKKLWESTQMSDLVKSCIINRNEDILDDNETNAVKKAEELSKKTNKVFDNEFESVPVFLQESIKNSNTHIRVYLQSYYNGVGIYPASAIYGDSDYTSDSNGRAVMYIKHYADFKNGELENFNSGNSYKTIDKTKLDNVVSFKSACDILEKELSSNMNMEFDDVKLWYEPRGKELDGTREDYGEDKDIYLTPKWYFLMYDNTNLVNGYSYAYYVYYVTVDCVTGEIHVIMPGGN